MGGEGRVARVVLQQGQEEPGEEAGVEGGGGQGSFNAL